MVLFVFIIIVTFVIVIVIMTIVLLLVLRVIVNVVIIEIVGIGIFGLYDCNAEPIGFTCKVSCWTSVKRNEPPLIVMFALSNN